jgi:hypothetical protein
MTPPEPPADAARAAEPVPEPPAPAPPVGAPPGSAPPAARQPDRPEQSREDTDAAWGEYPEPDDRLRRERPPHWDDF